MYTIVSLSQIERGTKFASEKTIQKFCTAFDCEPKDLFSFEQKRILTKEEKTTITDIKAMLENHPELIKKTLTFVINEIN